MANMDIAERRLPQDGRASFETTDGAVVDMRLASIPSLYGENITIRILENSPLPPTLVSLGFAESSLARFREAIKRPDGVSSSAGPQEAASRPPLHHARADQVARTQDLHGRRPHRTQAARHRADRGQAGHRPHLRAGAARLGARRPRRDHGRRGARPGDGQDGGRRRHHGHLVFTTLHTGDAISSINRLIEMGLPPYLVAAACRCIVSQRLVRRLCRHCKRPEALSAERWVDLGLGEAPSARMNIAAPVGCPKCFGTGYLGRLGLYEVLTVDDELREMIAVGASVGAMRTAAASEASKHPRRRRAQGARRLDQLSRARARDRLRARRGP